MQYFLFELLFCPSFCSDQFSVLILFSENIDTGAAEIQVLFHSSAAPGPGEKITQEGICYKN